MKRRFLIILILANCLQLTFASEKIFIADLLIYDYKGEKINTNQNAASILNDLLNDKYYNELLEFDTAKNKNYGSVTSSFDAAKLCSQIHCQYLFYGYVRKDINSWFTELKLYNANENIVEKIFFATDDLDNYDRMIEDLSIKIYDYYQNIFDLKVVNERNGNKKSLRVAFPFTVSYWTPITTNWNEVLLGVAGVNLGVEVYPSTDFKVIKKHITEFSFRPEFSYQFGLGKPSRYTANFHVLSINIPLIYNIYFSNIHTLKFGLGPFYELCALSFVPKYDDSIKELQNEIGLTLICGYEHKFNENWKMLLETDVKIPFNENPLINMVAKIGFSYFLYSGGKL